ncbi:CDC48 family AAA ATPase [Hyalangium gracile]|uniref:CDC48 family AAA ATPase n=1 Tax=Hyalangium gracile TaxID=394092 RepID=UPI001CCBD1E9|nr:CDC48 family AAA ATPase [Hyalangium gracile]
MTAEAKKRESQDAGTSLRVAEALAKDVGRGVARLDPKDLALLGAEVGDIILITGERTTVAKAMPAFSDMRGKGLLQIDGITRGNAKVGLDQRVRISKVPHAPATKIVLRPVGGAPSLKRNSDSRYVVRLLEGLPVIAGDRVRVTLFGSRYQDFEVVSTSPREGCAVVHAQTQITLEEQTERGTKSTGISYEDVGGLRKEIRRVREMIELPLRYPQIFERLGIDAPKGVLLYGPPGTGKTLLARAVAHETEAAFITVSGPEVIHKFYGESEAKLREIFEQARKKSPCIIFLDELDAIAPKRENVQGEVEKRVVAQLLALMDGLESRGQIIVIGATNLPNSLDPALRRPGRFDREIEIGIPDAISRKEILEIHTRGMPLAEDVNLERLAAITHAFVGADLEALCREAAMTTLRGVMPEIDFANKELPYEVLLSLKVTMDHFLSALAEVEPSGVREVFVEVPDVKWDQVGGLDSIKRELREAVEWPLQYADLFSHAGIRPAKGILLYGPPGTGKTLLAKAVASQSGVNFITVKGPALISKYVGESERAVREVFKKARQAVPCILFFDEIDSLAPVREAEAGDSGVSQRVISQLLTEMDGVEELKGVLVIAATNRRDMLDPALLRPGRFDLHLEVPNPDTAGRGRIFEVHLKGKPVAPDVDIAELAKQTQGCSGAEIEMVCHRAALLAVREFISAHGKEGSPSKMKITREKFEAAIAEIAR